MQLKACVILNRLKGHLLNSFNLRGNPENDERMQQMKIWLEHDHRLEVTKTQNHTPGEVFTLFGEKAQGEKCDAMEGLIKEAGGGVVEETEMGAVRDTGVVAAAQKVEHYEIATYGSLVAFARTLGEEEAASLLETLVEKRKRMKHSLE